MDAVITSIGFRQASANLTALRRKDFGVVVSGLTGFKLGIEAVRILKEFDPNLLMSYRVDGFALLDDDVRDELFRRAISEISEVAPLEEDMLFADLESGECPILYPDSLNMQVGWDGWGEMSADPDSYLTKDRSGPWALCSALRMGDESAFDSFAEYFGWDLTYPRLAGQEVDWGKMFKLLDKAGLGCFKTVWNIATYDTGNVYYDVNYYDEIMDDIPVFSLEGVLALKQQYQEALLLEAEYREASRLANEPGSTVLKAVVSIYKRCLKRDKDAPKRKTLAELFADAAGEDEENEYTDPMNVLDEHHGMRTLEQINQELRQTQNELEELARMMGDFSPFEYAENGPDQDEEDPNDGFGNNL